MQRRDRIVLKKNRPEKCPFYRNKQLNFIGCSVVCKIIICSEFPDIPDKAGRKTRRRAQAIAKRYAFHANAINHCFSFVFLILAACEEYYCNEDDLCEIYTLQDKKLVTDIF